MRGFLLIFLLLLANGAVAVDNIYGQNFGMPCPGGTALCKPVPLAPSVFYNFLVPSLPSDIVFSRGSTGWYFNSSGTLTAAASNIPRFDYDPVTLLPKGLLLETGSTNGVRNSTMQGAVTGTPGTLPNNWSSSIGGGLTQEISAVGTENGINYIDWHLSGTASSTSTSTIFFETATSIAAGQFQYGVDSLFLKLSGGSLANIDSTKLQFTANDSGGAVVTTFNSTAIVPTSANLSAQRFNFNAQFTSGSTARVRPSLLISYTSGAIINVTYRIGLPQMEEGFNAGRVTSPIPTSTITVTRFSDVANIPHPIWFNPTFGAFRVNAILPQASLAEVKRPLYFTDGTANNAYQIRTSFPSSGGTLGAITVAGSEKDSGTTLTFTPTSVAKFGLSYQSTNNFFAVDGALAGAGTLQASTLPAGINNLQLTSAVSVEWLQSISYWNYPLTSSQLQAVTQ